KPGTLALPPSPSPSTLCRRRYSITAASPSSPDSPSSPSLICRRRLLGSTTSSVLSSRCRRSWSSPSLLDRRLPDPCTRGGITILFETVDTLLVEEADASMSEEEGVEGDSKSILSELAIAAMLPSICAVLLPCISYVSTVLRTVTVGSHC
ncbi:hypothetical protein PIB30_066249, partial [Stylosanthes scabra]|nr:hypothetical protein [Stylosanthes scabra]